MYRVVVASFTFACAIGLVNVASATQESETIQPYVHWQIFWVDIFGSMRVRDIQRGGVFGFKVPTKFDMLDSKGIQSELALTASQKSKLDRLLPDFRSEAKTKLYELTEKTLVADRVTPEIEELQKHFVRWFEGQLEHLDDVLLPNQRNRLEELKYRFLFRKMGWRFTFQLIIDDFNRVADKDEQVSFKNRDVFEIKNAGRKEVEAVQGDAVKILEASFQAVISALSEEQKSDLKKRILECSGDFLPDFGLWFWQLGHPIDGESVSEETVSQWTKEKNFLKLLTFGNVPLFELSPESQLRPRLVDPKVSEYEEYYRELTALDLFSNNESVQTVLALTPNQVERAGAIVDEATDQIRKMNRESGDELSLVAKLERISAFGENAVADFHSLLLPHQLDALQEIAIVSDFLRRGLKASLCCGPMGDSLRLTAGQKTQIENAANEQRKTLVERTNKVEKRVIELLISKVADERARDIIREKLGDDLKSVLPTSQFSCWT